LAPACRPLPAIHGGNAEWKPAWLSFAASGKLGPGPRSRRKLRMTKGPMPLTWISIACTDEVRLGDLRIGSGPVRVSAMAGRHGGPGLHAVRNRHSLVSAGAADRQSRTA